MAEELKLILAKLDKLERDMQELKGKVETLNNRVEALESRMEAMDERMHVLAEDVTYLKSMERKIDRLTVLVESEVRRMINVVAEGHGVLHHRMDDVMDLYRDKERMEIELIDLRMNVNDVKQAITLA